MKSIQAHQSFFINAAGFLLFLTASSSASALCYVNGGAGGANTGVSWTDAYTDLQAALSDANCTEIWVAQGVYKPVVPANVGSVTPGERAVSFNIGPGVAVYGGFSGGENSLAARDPATHVTILSGDIDNNDTGLNGVDADTSKIVGSNTRHIVVMNGTAGVAIMANTVLDGFTLTGGDSADNAGALWCKGNGAGHACSPTLGRLAFSGNRAASNGGAMALDGYSGGVSSPTLTNITFSGNSAGLFGGAMYDNAQLAGGTSSPTLTNVTFSGNHSANYGGAMVNDASGTGTSNPLLTNVTFSGNSATNGGAMFNNGIGFGFSPKLINATFNGNSANYGGAIYNNNGNVLLLNSILWGDSATTNGSEFFSVSGETSLYYSIVEGGCLVSCGGSPIYTGDPLLGTLADNGGFTRTLMPGPGSAAINAVPCSSSSEAPVNDQRGAVRPDSASSGPNRCDIGAVEADSLPGDLIFADRFGSSPWDDF